MADSGGGGSADSYIGSLISLTSKSEIRYEGLLYTVDTENSNIALQNVRSFGTEGRKKDGPQIPSSDKVYEFIIFRGTDIKDLQVKMSPPPPIHNDPAIISLQAQASQPLSAPPPYVPPVADLIGHQSTYKASPVPYYHSASSGVALWAPPPPPQGPLSGNMPLYWQGFYGPPDQHRLMEPPSASVPAQTVAQGISVPLTPAAQSPSAPSGQDQTLAPPVVASTFNVSPPSHSPLSLEFSRVGSTAVPAVEPVHSNRLGLGTLLPFSSSQPTSLSSPNVVSCGLVHEGNGPDVPPSKLDEIKVQPHHDVCSVGLSGVSSASMSSPAPSTGRKGSFLPGKGPMVYKPVYKQVQVTKDHLNSGHRISAPKLQPPSAQPLLPLPVSPTQYKPFLQVHEGISRTSPMRRGGSRGRGIGRAGRSVPSRSKLLEDFDFIAMNEKFNKEEVWDELLKVESKDRVSEETGATQGLDYGLESKEIERVFDGSLSELSRRSVYVKDDFFDSLSCDSLGREHGRQERVKFSEQRKIDTETFGSFHVRSYRGGGGYRGRRGSSGGRRNVGRGQGHGFGYYNVSRGDGRPVG